MTPVHPGDQLDHYRIDTVVARSGMASIFRGVDLRTGSPVAVKVFGPNLDKIDELAKQIQTILSHQPGTATAFTGALWPVSGRPSELPSSSQIRTVPSPPPPPDTITSRSPSRPTATAYTLPSCPVRVRWSGPAVCAHLGWSGGVVR